MNDPRLAYVRQTLSCLLGSTLAPTDSHLVAELRRLLAILNGEPSAGDWQTKIEASLDELSRRVRRLECER